MKKLIIFIALLLFSGSCNMYLRDRSDPKQDAIRCAKNWKARGYTFDPNCMSCFEMYLKFQAIQRSKYWLEKGYHFDPNSMSDTQMNEKFKDIERARYWQQKGYIFDYKKMTASEMDKKALELDEVKYWKNIGYYYDPNSQIVFLDEDKTTKLSSIAGIHNDTGSGYRFIDSFLPSSFSSYSSSYYTPKQYPRTSYTFPSIAENDSYYGEISEATGRPKTVYVHGYYRKDGTYVRSHYRSSPRSIEINT